MRSGKTRHMVKIQHLKDLGPKSPILKLVEFCLYDTYIQCHDLSKLIKK